VRKRQRERERERERERDLRCMAECTQFVSTSRGCAAR
jgi:hypothetical protein